MGTSYRVVVVEELWGPSRDKLQQTIRAGLDGVDRKMSTWRSDSEVSAFNRLATTDWFPVSPETAEVVLAALEISRATNGAFDITVAPLVELWEFGPDPHEREVPDSEQIAEVLMRVGWQTVEVRTEPPALRKKISSLTIDLSAIAKGFAVDLVAEDLARAGIEHCLVEIGGEVRVAGRRLDGHPWRIGVEPPTSDSTLKEVLELTSGALATSGDYRNYFVAGAKRYSHVIDPRTGAPVDDAPASVSVVAPTCMEADALATAFMVMGSEAGMAFSVERHLSVRFLSRAGVGLHRVTTDSFEMLVVRR